ncbi:2-C-methyl-D-erythritol 4-phosphate cytidylyltransferase, partial [Xanthomonas oryzae pv. oryzae]
AILAAPVRDTLKRAGDDGGIDGTEPRERLWRALTPQLFRRHQLIRGLTEASAAGVDVTDEAMAMERMGLRPLLVEGAEDNFKVTTPADLARFEFELARRGIAVDADALEAPAVNAQSNARNVATQLATVSHGNDAT